MATEAHDRAAVAMVADAAVLAADVVAPAAIVAPAAAIAGKFPRYPNVDCHYGGQPRWIAHLTGAQSIAVLLFWGGRDMLSRRTTPGKLPRKKRLSSVAIEP